MKTPSPGPSSPPLSDPAPDHAAATTATTSGPPSHADGDLLHSCRRSLSARCRSPLSVGDDDLHPHTLEAETPTPTAVHDGGTHGGVLPDRQESAHNAGGTTKAAAALPVARTGSFVKEQSSSSNSLRRKAEEETPSPLASPPHSAAANPTPDHAMRRLAALAVSAATTTRHILLHSWLNIFLVFVPAGIVVAAVPQTSPAVVFSLNAIAIVPLAGLLGFATEAVARRMGDSIGALLNVTFGNAVELIIFIALVKNEIRIVQASLLGSILANLLLILGMSFLLGGLRFREQIYNSTITQTSACLLSLSVISLVLPTAFHASFSSTDRADSQSLKISRGTSVVLLLVYVIYLFFQLKSHAYMYESTPQHIIDEEASPGPAAAWLESSSTDDSDTASVDSNSSGHSRDTVQKRMRRVIRARRRKSSVASLDTVESFFTPSSLSTVATTAAEIEDNPAPALQATLSPQAGDNAPPARPLPEPSTGTNIQSMSEMVVLQDEPGASHGTGRRSKKHHHHHHHHKHMLRHYRHHRRRQRAGSCSDDAYDAHDTTAAESTIVELNEVTEHHTNALTHTAPVQRMPATSAAAMASGETRRVDFAMAGGRQGVGVRGSGGCGDDGGGAVAATATVDATAARRAFTLRTMSLRPVAKSLAPAVFKQSVGASLAPATLAGPIPRVRYGIRRTNSLPDRLNQYQIRPPGAMLPSQISTFKLAAAADDTNANANGNDVDGPAGQHEDGSGAASADDGLLKLSRKASVLTLLITTGLVALCAEFMVDSISGLVATSPVNEVFIGLIILPIVGNAAEHVTAVMVAMKNKMDLAIGVAVGSSIQIALFMTPLVVILGWMIGRDMTLYFTLFETVCLFVSAFIVNFLVLDGRSNYLEGALLCATYVIIGLAAFFYPDTTEESTWG